MEYYTTNIECEKYAVIKSEAEFGIAYQHAVESGKKKICQCAQLTVSMWSHDLSMFVTLPSEKTLERNVLHLGLPKVVKLTASFITLGM